MLASVPAAVLAGWLLHGAEAKDAVRPSPPAPLPAAGGARGADLVDVEALRFPPTVSSAGSQRNVFAFNEPVARVARRVDEGIRPSSPVVVAEVPTPVVTTTPPEPELGYRCIGTFGPPTQRFAVFAGAGEIVNVRIGEAVGKTAFILREIGLETITVELPAANLVKRLAIGS